MFVCSSNTALIFPQENRHGLRGFYLKITILVHYLNYFLIVKYICLVMRDSLVLKLVNGFYKIPVEQTFPNSDATSECNGLFC